MANYPTVVCGITRHTIYITNPKDMTFKDIPVTYEAIAAVRDYMVDDIPKNESSVGYSWKRSDGKTVKLICIVE